MHIYFKKKYTHRRQTDFHLLLYSPNVCNIKGWTGWSPAARAQARSPMWVARDASPWAITTTFQGAPSLEAWSQELNCILNSNLHTWTRGTGILAFSLLGRPNTRPSAHLLKKIWSNLEYLNNLLFMQETSVDQYCALEHCAGSLGMVVVWWELAGRGMRPSSYLREAYWVVEWMAMLVCGQHLTAVIECVQELKH